MSLTTLPLGRSGLQITRVGLGAWAIGGGDWAYGWGPQEDADSVATIRHAVDRGITWIDTAAEYGYGHSEEVVARALRDVPKDARPFVFTKCGLVWDPTDRLKPSQQIGEPASIRRECDASLRRLGVERLDLLEMHWPARDGTEVEDYWGALVQLRREGKIRAAGLSNHDVASLERAQAVGPIDVIQPPLSAIDRRAAGGVISWAEAHDVGVIVYSPMQSGLLSGTFTVRSAEQLAQGDWRRSSPDFTDRLAANLALAEALKPIADRHGVTPGAITIAWTLAWSGVTGAIVGARRPAQIDGWIDAATVQLTGDDLDDIASAIAATGAGEGPNHPLGSWAPSTLS